jgi:hypothetical protein
MRGALGRALVHVAAVALPVAAPCAAAQPEPPAATREREAAVDAAAFFAKARAAYADGPVTERLRVGVRRGEGYTRRSLLLVRTEPTEDGRAVARVLISAGRLLIDARGGFGDHAIGTVRVALGATHGPVFERSMPEAGVGELLEAALPPLPLAVVDLVGPEGGAPVSLTPYARNVRWADAATAPRAGELKLEGQFADGLVSVTIDRASGRLRRVLITHALGSTAGTVITIEHAPSTARLAEVSIAGPDGQPRPRVETMSALADGAADLAAGTPLSIAAGGDGEVLKGLARGPDGRPRPALVLLAGPDERARSAAAAVLDALAGEIGAARGADVISVGLGAAWDAADSAPRWAAWGARPGAEPVVAGAGSRVNAELRRVAPGSGAAFVVIAPDREILAVHPLEHLPADPEQQVVELLMSVLDAVQSGRPTDERDPR